MRRGLDYEAHAPVFGDPIIRVDLDGELDSQARPTGSILVGIDERGRVPDVDADAFDVLLTTAPDAPLPWVSVADASSAERLAQLKQRAALRPLAAATLAQVLRVSESLSFADALVIESFAYSTLLGGREFRAWREAHRPRPKKSSMEPRVRFTREEGVVTLCLANPARLNAFDARMRDDLVDALHAVADDPSVARLRLLGDGPAFSTGGDLDEFGSTPDTATGHAIRTLRSPALLVHELRERTVAYVHGACIGAGIEIPSAAGRVVAAPDAWFRLPEVGMGLIPGAGGTATIPRRIGRHRTLYWALADVALHAQNARAWGLVDEIGCAA